jgi:hypothetical protein
MTKHSTKPKAHDGVEAHRAMWEGVEVEIRFERNWLGSPPSDFHPSRLEAARPLPDAPEKHGLVRCRS